MKSAILAFAAAALGLAVGHAAAIPNVTDLSVFGGRVAGTSDVKTSTGADYHGSAVIRPAIAAGGLAAKFKVLASAKVRGHTVPISNVFTFTAAGRFLGRELAPGDTSGVRMRGFYTATGGGITFSGKFKVRETEGTFTGTVGKFGNGRLTIVYSIFVGDNPKPLYVYTFTGKPPRP